MNDCRCPICESRNIEKILEIKDIPVFQNKLYDNVAAARQAHVGEMRLCVCEDCSFVFNSAFDGNLVAYDEQYENDQTQSLAFLTHVDKMIKRAREEFNSKAIRRIVEVGCGQGHFLKRLRLSLPSDTELLGFDPAYRGASTQDRISFYPIGLNLAPS